MTKSEKIILIACIILLTAGAGIFFFKKDSGPSYNDLLEVKLTPFQMNGGWGYDIHVGKDFGIHQDCIPAIAGHKLFATREDALKTGRLVVEKIKHKKTPMVSVRELDSLGIHY